MGDQILQTTGSVQRIADAYKCIGVHDTSIPDGDVAVAFYTAYSFQWDRFDGNPAWPVRSLDVIADSRQSQLLAFVREMIPHLTKEKVNILATKTPPAQITESLTITNFEVTSGEPGFQIHKSPTNPVHASPELIIFDALVSSKPMTQGSATAVDTSDLNDGIGSDQPDDASNFSADFFSSNAPSSDYDSNTSQISEPAGGKFWNGEALCCKICNEELNDEGECDDGHTINPCRYCGKEFEPLACSRFCIECHRELSTSCSICNEDGVSHEDELTEAIQMVWDDKDNVWRCTTCMWEVEANSENEGQCQCTVDPEVSSHCAALQLINLNRYRDSSQPPKSYIRELLSVQRPTWPNPS